MTDAADELHDSDKRQRIIESFHDAVNMTPAKLEKWLQTDDSKAVGFKENEGDESVGHQSGRRIVQLLRTSRSQLKADDIAHMRKVAGYVHRHLAQRPGGDVSHTRWRYSLMNWGHDPLEK